MKELIVEDAEASLFQGLPGVLFSGGVKRYVETVRVHDLEKIV